MRSFPRALLGIRWLVAATAVVALAPSAWGDRFGGFSADESRVLLDSDLVCTVQRLQAGKVVGERKCVKAGADQVAQGKFRPGKVEAGPDAKLKASHRGSRLEIAGQDGLPSFSADVFDPVVRIVAVQRSPRGEVVAVEYVIRSGGREKAEVVAVRVAAGAAPAPGPERPPAGDGGSQTPTTAPPTDVAGPSAVDKAVLDAVAKARKTFAKGGKKNTAAAAKLVLDIAPAHPEGLYYAAVAAALGKDAKTALIRLEQMGSSTDSDAGIWRVEARFQKAFAALRAEPRFRAAVALDVAPATLYERLLGFGGEWEQAGTPCTDPTVKLDLQRIVPKFKLRITSTCQGMKDTTRLAGTWRPSPSGFELVFPNVDSKDEIMPCQTVSCGAEICLRCQIDQDLSFEVASVRR